MVTIPQRPFSLEDHTVWEIPRDAWDDDCWMDLDRISENQASFHTCVDLSAPTTTTTTTTTTTQTQQQKHKLRPRDCIRCALWLKAYKATHERQPRDSFFYSQAGVLYVDYDGLLAEDPEPADGFAIFTSQEDERAIENVGVRGTPSGYTGSSGALRFLEDQIAACVGTHNACGDAQHTGSLPTRVVDVQAVSPDVRVWESNGAAGKYAALSYCWGQHGNLKTTSQTYAQHTSRLPWGTLPKTFQDAVDVCRKLGIPFLWIDALCIVQDSPADWDRESAAMGAVYGNAFLTIAASASTDPLQGCYYATSTTCSTHVAATVVVPSGANEIENDARRTVPLLARREWNHADQHASDWHPPFERRLHASFPLKQRAWVFQEQLLSARLIQFAQHELMWTCRARATCECTHGVPGDKLRPGISEGRTSSPRAAFDALRGRASPARADAAEAWKAIVAKGYAHLALSVAADRLPALSGVAAGVDRGVLGRFYAGLWEYDFALWMCWVVVEAGCEADDDEGRRVMGPTWSWCSVRKRVAWNPWSGEEGLDAGRRFERADVKIGGLEVECRLAGRNRYGRVSEGVVRVTGRVFKGLRCEPGLLRRAGFHDETLFLRDKRVLCHWDYASEKGKLERPSWVHCLHVFTGSGDREGYLALECVDETNRLYVRRGFAEFYLVWKPKRGDMVRLKELLGAEHAAYFDCLEEGVEQTISII